MYSHKETAIISQRYSRLPSKFSIAIFRQKFNAGPGRKIFHNKLACIIENNSMTYRYELCTSIRQPGLLDN